MATINSENAKQIRDPMEVYIHFFAGDTATISSYTIPSYKSNDNTLDNTSWTMRKITDLANGGFPLDGSCEWYDAALTPSASDGKLGVRGNIGANVVVNISASSVLTSVTIASKNVLEIQHNGQTYPGTGLNVIPINANSASITFTPIDSDSRIEINYIVPGVEFAVTNDNLISCNLALRGNLDVIDHTWEESEITFSMYYPYNIASSFAYINGDFPITYQAGYDSDLSQLRKFYLSEPVTQDGNVISIHGVDASRLLESSSMREQWFSVFTGNAHQSLYSKFINAIETAGIILVNKQSWSGSQSGSRKYSIIPEMSARDFVSGVMNLTLNHKRNLTYYGIQFVDAGIPSVEHGNGTTFGNTCNLNKSDCGEWSEQYEQNISAITNINSDRKFNESISVSNTLPFDNIERGLTGNVNQTFEFDFDGWYRNASPFTASSGSPGDVPYTFTIISKTPSRIFFKVTQKGTKPFTVGGSSSAIKGGVNGFSNPNTLPGITFETEPMVYGALTDSNGETLFNYPSLFNRSLRTGSFKYKGDPRMQPLDYLNITNDTSDGRGNVTARITAIELTHEKGGTDATITWREWN